MSALVVPKSERQAVVMLERALERVTKVQAADEAHGLLASISALEQAVKRLGVSREIEKAAKSLLLCAERRLAQLVPLDESLTRYGFSEGGAQYARRFAEIADERWDAALERARERNTLSRSGVLMIVRGGTPRAGGSNKDRSQLTPTMRITDIMRWADWCAREALLVRESLDSSTSLDLSRIALLDLESSVRELVELCVKIEPYVDATEERFRAALARSSLGGLVR